MKKRNRLLALLGASVLTLSVAGVALAEDLNSGQVGQALSTFFNQGECAEWPQDAPAIGAGQIGVHFLLTSPAAGSGTLTASFSNPASSVGPVANYTSPAEPLHWYIVITGDGTTVINSASTNVDGGNLNVSHACPGAPAPTPTPGGPTPTPGGPTPTPTFGLETGGITECPCDTLPGVNTSGPADGAWLLVVALGVLLASIVVLTPARARSRR